MNKKLPKRKNIRIKDYDYCTEGMYFITICTKDRKKVLGNIVNNDNIILSSEGRVVQEYIKVIQEKFENIVIDEYIIMPNHLHFIINITTKNTSVTIPKIIKQYKEKVTKEIGYSIWQKSYYEHIIRNEIEYYAIVEYIRNNIINWQRDKYCAE